jgi:hypothetical protein
MEREKELLKLVNVLRQTARTAMHSELTEGDKGAAAFCVDKYNRVLARLTQLDASVAAIYEPLPPDSSLTVTAMACRQLAAYYEDELGPRERLRQAYGFAFDPQSFKDFWHKSGRDIEDLGEFIRESIAEWTRRRHPHPPRPKHEGGAEGAEHS